MFTSVYRFFTTANFAFTIGNLEFAVEDVLRPCAGVVHPAGNGEVGLLHNLLYDSGSGGHLSDGCGDARRARRGLNDTAGGTNEDFSLTTCDLILTLSNIALALSESLRSFRSDITPNAFVYCRLWDRDRMTR
jgi:hypothetical protein